MQTTTCKFAIGVPIIFTRGQKRGTEGKEPQRSYNASSATLHWAQQPEDTTNKTTNFWPAATLKSTNNQTQPRRAFKTYNFNDRVYLVKILFSRKHYS